MSNNSFCFIGEFRKERLNKVRSNICSEKDYEISFFIPPKNISTFKYNGNYLLENINKWEDCFGVIKGPTDYKFISPSDKEIKECLFIIYRSRKRIKKNLIRVIG